jgi:hypothetical protein
MVERRQEKAWSSAGMPQPFTRAGLASGNSFTTTSLSPSQVRSPVRRALAPLPVLRSGRAVRHSAAEPAGGGDGVGATSARYPRCSRLPTSNWRTNWHTLEARRGARGRIPRECGTALHTHRHLANRLRNCAGVRPSRSVVVSLCKARSRCVTWMCCGGSATGAALNTFGDVTAMLMVQRRKEAYCPECGACLDQTNGRSRLPLGKSRPITWEEMKDLPYSPPKYERLCARVKMTEGDYRAYREAKERRRAEVAARYDK